MSTAGQAIGGVVGAVIGFFTGGPTGALYGAQIGMMAGGYLDPPKGPHTEGPRLNDLSVQTSTYGAVIPRVYGTVALYGNIFWLENNALKETATSESQGGKGGPTSTSTTYSYSATFAIGLCEGPIAGVRRIWCGAKLIYDAGSSDISTVIASNESAGLFTLHTGSDTQLPDARMQAALGVANTPAYRGLAYLVLNDFPLAEHGNSLMQAPFKVEVVASGSVVFYDSTPRSIPVGDYIDVAWNGAVFCAITTGSTVATSPDGVTWINRPIGFAAACHGIAWNGHVFCIVGSPLLCATSPDGVAWTSRPFVDGSWHRAIAWGGGKFCAVGVSATEGHVSADATTWQSMFTPVDAYAIAWNGTVFCVVGGYGTISAISTDGLIWTATTIPAGLYRSIAWNGVVFCAVGDAGVIATSPDGVTWTARGFNAAAWLYIVWTGDEFYIILEGTATMSSPDGVVWTSRPIVNGQWHAAAYNGVISVVGSSVAATVIPYQITGDMPQLSDILKKECLASNLLTSGDLDTSALTQSVRGYRVASVAAIRSALEPLQGAWPFDAVQHGYVIKFKPRGSASVATIPAVDLDARGAGEKPGVSITSTREMDSVLPARVSLKYLDLTREYDTSEQYAERLNTDAVNIRSMDMPLVMTAAEAAANAEMLLYLYWLERYDLSFRLPPTYNQLEPGDVITVNASEATYSLRLTAVTYTQDGRLECAAKYDRAAIYTPAAVGEEGQSTGATLTQAGATRYELLDIPLLLDSTDLPGFPVAMSGYLAGWPGGVLMRSDDAGQTWASLQGFTRPGAVMGVATNALGTGRTELFDQAGALAVVLYSGALYSVSESALFAGANHFAYGDAGRWEIIAAKTCVLQGDGSYVLTDLLRGRQGSEWACALHAAGDKLVLLDSAQLVFLTANLNSIGQARSYRGITAGKTLDSDSDKSFAYTGVNLKCLAPVYLNGNRNPSTNDWTLDWLRRTRVGGAWRDYVDATLGEAAQSYEIDIFSSAAYTTLKRTLSGLATPAATYTSAQQVTDFGSNQATLYVKVYQVSANVGRGYPLTTSITR